MLNTWARSASSNRIALAGNTLSPGDGRSKLLCVCTPAPALVTSVRCLSQPVATKTDTSINAINDLFITASLKIVGDDVRGLSLERNVRAAHRHFQRRAFFKTSGGTTGTAASRTEVTVAESTVNRFDASPPNRSYCVAVNRTGIVHPEKFVDCCTS